MSTNSVVGAIRNGKIEAVDFYWDGYPTGVGKDIQEWLAGNDNNIEAFLGRTFKYGQWSDIHTPYEETQGDDLERTLCEFAEDVFIEYAYLFNFDNQTFYVCCCYANRVRVAADAAFEDIAEIDMATAEKRVRDDEPLEPFPVIS